MVPAAIALPSILNAFLVAVQQWLVGDIISRSMSLSQLAASSHAGEEPVHGKVASLCSHKLQPKQSQRQLQTVGQTTQ